MLNVSMIAKICNRFHPTSKPTIRGKAPFGTLTYSSVAPTKITLGV